MTYRPADETPPVLVLGYRRPDLVAEVMQEVARAKPKRLFLACDGPHPDRPDEAALVAATRAAMEDAVTWECEVLTRYSETNQGCRRGVESAISWFFDHVPEGIILEDDCVPHPHFFPFCADLLDRYRHNHRIMHISGDGSLAYPGRQINTSFVFSREALVWGWATWQRAWNLYDSNLTAWEEIRSSPERTQKIFSSPEAAKWWTKVLDRILTDGQPDSWAYRWSFSVFYSDGLCVVPTQNLISNVGHRHDSTHTFDANSPRAGAPVSAILPLRPPKSIGLHRRHDRRFEQMMRGFRPASRRAPSILRKVFDKSLRRISRMCCSVLGRRRSK